MVDLVRQFRILIRLALLSELEYRGNLLQSLIGGAAYQAAQLLFIGVILNAFGAIGGWQPAEIIFLVGLRMAAHAVYAFGFRQVIDADTVVHTGEFDRFLLRPASPFLQLLTRRFNLQQVGDVIIAAVVLGYAISQAGITWTPATVAFCALSVVGGGLIEAALQTLRGALAFRLRNTESLIGMIDNLLGTYGNFPLHIFGLGGAVFFTMIVPLAFVAWAPAAVLLGRADQLWFPTALGWASPLIGLILFGLAIAAFTAESRHYSSPGS
ncbi:ABC transporter permease [Microlunatus sp. GCM10028923]|uniref:ABC transporter permease n=1 Tax=Microlunatus sp. GCM10028923 TaxID=3273400 RepID=UPI003608981B